MSNPLEPELTLLRSLLTQTRPLLRTPPSQPTPQQEQQQDPLTALQTLPALLRAHTTKLSIALQPPHALHAAAKSSLSEILSLTPHFPTALHALPRIPTLRTCLTTHVEDVFTALERLMHVLAKSGDMLAGTGAVWAACDALSGAAGKGVHGVLAGVLAGYAGLVSDAMDEVKAGEVAGGDLGGAKEGAVRKMRLVGILLGAVRKRRFEGEGVMDACRVEGVLECVRRVSEVADDVGVGFCEEDFEEVAAAQKRFEGEAVKLVDLVAFRDGSGVEDRYTKWFLNCRKAILKEG